MRQGSYAVRAVHVVFATLGLGAGLLVPGLLTAAAQDDEGGIQFAPDDEPAKPAQPPANTPPPATRHTTPPVDQPAEIHLKQHYESDRIFGTYRIRIAVGRPDFNDGLKYYDRLYGTPKLYPEFSADYFPWGNWYVNLGLKLSMGYYTASGHPAAGVPGVQNKNQLSDSQIQPDYNENTTLTLIPLQASLVGEITPFSKKWVVLEGFIGMEKLYFQEVREPPASSTPTTSPTVTTTTTTTTTTSQPVDTTLTNRGWKTSTVIGAAASILLNPLDETTANSLLGTMGIGYVYMSPYAEQVRTYHESGVSFGRMVYGLGFTFESVD